MNPPVRSSGGAERHFSVALATFWRMHDEVQLPENLASGHDEYESGLRDRPTDHERDCALTQCSRAEHALAYRSAAEERGKPGRSWPR